MNKLKFLVLAGLSALLVSLLSTSCGDKIAENQIDNSVLSIGLASNNENIKSLADKGGSFFLQVTTSDEWTLSLEPESAKEWIRLEHSAGDYAITKEDIRIDVLENKGEKERTAELILTSGSAYKKFFITQHGVKGSTKPDEPDTPEEPTPTPPTPQAGVVFLETFGIPVKVGGKWLNINDYKDYDVKTNTYTDPFFNKWVKASVRKSGTLGGHVWLAAKGKWPSHTALKISGFKTGTGLKLSFKLADNTGTLMANALKLSTDKGEVAMPATLLKKNEFQEFTVTLPDNAQYIQFEADNLPDGVRIDDVKLVADGSTGGGTNPQPTEKATLKLPTVAHATVKFMQNGAEVTEVNAGTQVEVVVTPEAGYELKSLKANGEDIFASKTFTAKKGENTLEVIIKAKSGGGSSTTPIPPGEHIEGDVSLLELPRLAGGTNNYFVTHKTSDGVVNFSLEYDVDRRHARWVACQFNDQNSDKNTERSDAWAWDPKVPSSFATGTSNKHHWFSGTGYSRGHLIASHDRLQSREANKQTFYYTNMSPQLQSHNGGIWLRQEQIVQSWGRNRGFRDVLYVAKGGTIKDGQIKSERIKGKMVIPEYFFMAIVVKKGNEYHGIAFWTEHRKYSHTSLRSVSLSIDELEQKTGLDFFHNFPDEIENKFEAETASSHNWPGL